MQREYSFSCNSCSYEFDLTVCSEEIIGYKTDCPQCKSKDTYRNYSREKVMCNDGEPRTLGSLADLNSKKRKIQIDGPSKKRNR